jgi:hypothetical protein
VNPRTLAVLLLALAAACSEDKSFVVVSAYSSVHPIANVAQLRVKVTDGQYSEQLLYPETPRAATALLRLDPTTPVTFSVSFRPLFKDDVTFDVDALDGTLASLGRGTSAAQSLRVGQVTSARVDLAPTCDPVAPATCGVHYTCALVCDQDSRPETLCYSAGNKEPGEACTDIADCVPGSACFEYKACSTVPSPVKTCRQFCHTDADCGAGSFCNTSVACDTTSAPLRICSRPCSPTAGCALGLGCFTYAGGITDCACP